jgi:hypothetical protein
VVDNQCVFGFCICIVNYFYRKVRKVYAKSRKDIGVEIVRCPIEKYAKQLCCNLIFTAIGLLSGLGFILGLFFISGFAGFLPVVAEGLGCKWLIISVFLGFAGLLLGVCWCFLSEPLIHLILLIWVVWVLWFLLSYRVYFSFPVLLVFCRLLHGGWGVSS